VAVYTGLSTKPVNPTNPLASLPALLNLSLKRIIRLKYNRPAAAQQQQQQQ